MVHNERRPSSNQGGFMTVMFLILLGLFLTFAAFALDLGNLYLWGLRLDKAARAGSLAGLGYRGVHGWNDASTTTGNSDLIIAAKQAVQDNFQAYGVSLDSSNITVNYSSVNDSIGVTVSHTPSTILIGKLDRILNYGFNAQQNAAGNSIPMSATLSLKRRHEASLNRANVVLLLDVSGSMLCPAPGQDPAAYPEPCSCRKANACGGAITKLDRLVTAVQRFANHFNPDRDRISVIAFNLAAQRLYSFGTGAVMRNAPSPHPSLAGTTAYQFLTNRNGNLGTVLTALAGSNTNHCDALAEGIRELEDLSKTLLGNDDGTATRDRRNLQPFLVFFTDGAPNAMRGIFTSGQIPPGQCDTYNAGVRSNAGNCGTEDFYHYALEWVTVDGGVTKQYRGPGPFVARQTDGDGIPRLFNFPIAANAVAPNGSKTCGVEAANGNPLIFEQTITRDTSTGAGGRGHVTNGCLSPGNKTFSFSIPYTNPNATGGYSGAYKATVSGVPISTSNTTWRDPNWPSVLPAPPAVGYGLQKYDELPYYCAIEAADYIRTRFAATIFAVGLGTATTHLQTGGQDDTCSDPLQDPDDHTSRKDFFLTRLAFAKSMFDNQLVPTSIRQHYQIAGSQLQRTISGCSDHRLMTADAAAKPQVGYTSNDLLADGNNTYLDLRPIRPASMDTLLSGGAGTRRMETQGEYFATDNANEVPRIFDLIAKTILLRSSS